MFILGGTSNSVPTRRYFRFLLNRDKRCRKEGPLRAMVKVESMSPCTTKGYLFPKDYEKDKRHSGRRVA